MSDFGNLRRYLTLPTRKDAQIARDVADELRHHIELRTHALEQSGLSTDDARAEALREFGDLDDAAAYCKAVDRQAERRRRGRGVLEDLRYDFAHALRLLRRAPSFAAATVFTLGLAIGTTVAVSSVSSTYLLRAMPFADADRLVFVGARDNGGRRGPSLDGVDWKRVEPLFDGTAAWDIDGFTLPGTSDATAESVTGAWVSPGYFETLGVRPEIGRPFRADEYAARAPVALISHDLWRRRFHADSSIIGRTIAMFSVDHPTAATSITIVGVLGAEFWPIQWDESGILRPLPPNESGMPLLARLKPGVTAATTERQLDAVLRPQIRGAVDAAWRMRLVPTLERHSARARPVLVATLAAAVFMLLAACASVASTVASRSAARRHEVGIRLALGASASRIARQLFAESAVLGALAGVLGIATAVALLGAASLVIERQLGTRVPGGVAALQPTVAITSLSLLASVVLGGLVGIPGALSTIRFHRSRRLATKAPGRTLRRILIAAQVAMAMVLLFGAGLMVRTIARLNAVELGFQTNGVFHGSLLLSDAIYNDSAKRRDVMNRLVDGIAQVGGVRGAAAVFPTPFSGGYRFPVLAEGTTFTDDNAPPATVFTISGDYLATMGIPLRDGRRLSAMDDARAPLVVMISQSLAQQIAPGGNAIGRRIRVRVPFSPSFNDIDNRPWRTVVGVVGDTRKDFDPDPPADVYVPYAQNPRSYQSIVIRSDADRGATLEAVRRATGAIDPNLALFGVESMNDVIAARSGQQRGLSALLAGFASFTLALSAMALFASLSFAVTQRKSELAVRLAIGATRSSILRLVVGETAAVVAFGVGVGAIASLALGRLLEHQVYGVATSDRPTLIAISLLLMATAIAAGAVPSLRALHTDPSGALRE